MSTTSKLHNSISTLEKTRLELLELADSEHNVYIRKCADDLDLLVNRLERTLDTLNTQ